MDEAGIKFLDKLYGNLYMSDVVQHTKEDSDDRVDAIRKYLERLEKLHKFATTQERKEFILNMYFDKYVIKPENIDKNNIPAGESKESIIDSQKKRLASWINYLTDPTTSYPTWAKYWVFQGMLKMGSYDETKGKYLTRNSKTIANFPIADPAAIAKSIETIMKLVSGEKIDDITEQRLSKTDSFNKIYTIFLKQAKQDILDNGTEGIWIKYNQGDKEGAIRLSKSVDKYDTGWCTSGEQTAISQICGPYDDAWDGGDFYVYYTKNNDGVFEVPRIAIRCNGTDSIGEIRGVEEGQNMEESMIQILKEKLLSIPSISQEDVDKNLDIIEDLNELHDIGVKTEKKELLTETEIIDLYTKKLKSFGWDEENPKQRKIKKQRNIIEDYNNTTKKVKSILLSRLLLPKPHIIGKEESLIETDREVMIEAVKKNFNALEYASNQLRDDKDVILTAIKQAKDLAGYVMWDYASERLRDDKEVILTAINIAKSPMVLNYASERLKDDDEVVLTAIKKSPYSISAASDRLKAKYESLAKQLKKETKKEEKAKKRREFKERFLYGFLGKKKNNTGKLMQ